MRRARRTVAPVSWFADVALDGIVSGVIGGAVTGGAVWWTLRHERQTAAMAELRAAVARFHSITMRAGTRLLEAQTLDENASVMNDVFDSAVAAQAFAWRPAPKLASDLASFLTAWNAAFDTPGDVSTAIPLAREGAARTYGWLSDPAEYQKAISPPRWKDAAEAYEASARAQLEAEYDSDG